MTTSQLIAYRSEDHKGFARFVSETRKNTSGVPSFKTLTVKDYTVHFKLFASGSFQFISITKDGSDFNWSQSMTVSDMCQRTIRGMVNRGELTY